VNENVPGYEAVGWYGVGAPKDTPHDIIEKLNATMNAALEEPTPKARLADLGVEPMRKTPRTIRAIPCRRKRKVGRRHPRGQD
jgi:tripartite-type tricarboxylate transporter receptor subunit TctC